MSRKRKSPVRHRVKTHTRNGKRVTSYMRGHGKQKRQTAHRKIQKSRRKKWEEYTVTFKYSKNRRETVKVYAKDSDDALNLALEKRKMKLKPLEIIIKDGLGAIIGKIAGKVRGGIKEMAEAYREEKAKTEAEMAAAREKIGQEMLTKAKAGDRAAQMWLEKRGVAWKSV